jgi:hypothetical protein
MAQIFGVVVALTVTSGAFAYWTTSGSGNADAQTMAGLPLTVTPGTPSGRLHPGGQADVALAISNPNPYTARIGALSLDTGQGTNGYTVDAGHAGCGVSSLSFIAQTNGGAGWSVPPKVGVTNGSLAVSLTGALSMALNAAQSCQGATFTVYLSASADYLTSTLTTSGVLNYWRLGDDPNVADAFTDTPGSTLQSHTGETGASWIALPGSESADEVVTDANRLRRDGGYTVYTASGAAADANYAVQADVYVRSTVAGDMTGVIGRVATDNPNGTFYYARYQQSDTAWHLLRYANGVSTDLATSTSGALTVGQTYRLRLDMIGSAIKLYVNEVVRASATDGAIVAAGRGGILDGDWKTGTTGANTNATGLHLDNVRVVGNTGTTVTDRRGVNPGTYVNGPLLNVPGALAGDFNTAVRFDGTNQYATVSRQIADDFSIEFWFSSTQGRSTQAYSPPSWWQGAGLVDAEVTVAPPNDFGVSLRADGMIIGGIGGSPDLSIRSATGYNNGEWHHVVLTRTRTSGAFNLYVDGASVGTATGSTASLNASANINFGRLASGANYFAGALDEVAIYNTALTAPTVADHYHAGFGS